MRPTTQEIQAAATGYDRHTDDPCAFDIDQSNATRNPRAKALDGIGRLLELAT